jgi:hypothetical protein
MKRMNASIPIAFSHNALITRLFNLEKSPNQINNGVEESTEGVSGVEKELVRSTVFDR